MIFSAAFLAILAGLSALSPDQVHVEQVEGEVLYGAGTSVPRLPVKVGEDLGPGTFAAGSNGILYLSCYPGSYLRLAETGTIRFIGIGEFGPGGGGGPQHSFALRQGKLRVNAVDQKKAADHYSIQVERDRVATGQGSCVLCMHGDGTYIFVARGHVMLFSAQGAAADRIKELGANGSIGMLESDGTVRIRPLSSVASSTQNCLLAGLKPDAAAGVGNGPPVDSSGPVVSPIQ